jgi:BolA protein
MNINKLISIVKKKIEDQLIVESISVEDKSFLHKNHSGNQPDKYHLKLTIKSNELIKKTKIERSKKIHKILHDEIKNYIHSIEILIC